MMEPIYNTILRVIGAVTVGYISFNLLSNILRSIKVYFLSGPLGLATDLRKLGQWAVVTGATDGIGKAYAKQLAAKGINIVLISRTLTKLQSVAMEIESEYKVKTKVIAVNFFQGVEIYQEIKEGLDGLEIGTLVNNVGTSSLPDCFLDIPNLDKHIPEILNCNVLSCTMMTKLVLPQMVKRSKGAVINIASVAGYQPNPFSVVYSSTKAYVDFFSRGLHEEYSSKGIFVQSVLTFFVATKLSGIDKSETSFFVPLPEDFTKSALGTVGLQSRTHGYFSHALQVWLVNLLPRWYITHLTEKMFMDMKNKALKEIAQKKE
ncbi:very-long-chain 3-oxoacyl-CoA reductase-B-like [Saccoglossus kowalevskii]|uniref:Estradiol 17-beta-dehydrogenase 12-like n=1 Tax=Saccoglossus kowalevskii TaxID=10224 RepID=A0ABM0GMZ9_SACKO|nr:PREDICTED: estradiol 17-beta-dehydrogenase 12-like [Saccoglossus kowalevskii]